ncbi:MAG TPA: prenyltransferase/squalene oxidase repeat-containing protein, partial [Pirellulales bacterium]|nr:prenyltransferase/squalene oxidase repeat-containing protein [Pirellulales bacterium]
GLEPLERAATAGKRWLLDLQNADGGWPTFCRGWGKLPFDRSGADLTAHALRALRAWATVPGVTASETSALAHRAQALGRHMERAIQRGFEFLARSQQRDGTWIPLWFGNQHHSREENPVYGTARVLLAYRDYGRVDSPAAQRGLTWLASAQNDDGGWGSRCATEAERSGVEETALAVDALVGCASGAWQGNRPAAWQGNLEKGLAWLIDAVETGRHTESSPIGFYFAKLWYYEALYPLIFTASALGQAALRLGQAGQRRPALQVEPTTAR